MIVAFLVFFGGFTFISQFEYISGIEQVSSSIEQLDDISQRVEEEPDNVIYRVEKNPVVYIDCWYNNTLDVDDALSLGLTGEGVTIAVLDTGIASMNELNSKVIARYDFSEGLEHENGVPVLEDDHGTNVASIISSNSFGIAPGAKLIDFNIGIGDCPDVSVAGTIKAYEKIIELLDSGTEIDIVLMCYNSDYFKEEEKNLLSEIASRGVFLVASSGNDATNVTQYPASLPEVITVGSIGEENTLSDFSNFGPSVDVVAPGEDIFTLGFDEEYLYFSGTSASAPLVSGVLALYKEAYPTLSKDEITQMLFDNAKDLGPEGKDEEYGYGLVSAVPPKQYVLDDTQVDEGTLGL